MDIQFVEEQYRDDIFKLMQLCSIDLPEAYQLYQNAGTNFQSAVAMHFNKGQPQQHENNKKMQSKALNQNKANNQFAHEDFDDLYERYVAHKQTGLTFNDKYEVRREDGGLMGYVPAFLKKAPENQFKKNLQQFTGRPCSVKFCLKSVSQAIEQACWKQKFPLVVHCLNFSQETRAEISATYREQMLVDALNVQFRNYGLDTKNYNLEQEIKQFIDLKQPNCFVVLRVNSLDQIQLLEKIRILNLSGKQIIKRLKLIKNICINRQMDEAHAQRRLREQLMGNYNYKKPVSTAERKKLANDRALRKKQEQQFYQTMKKQQQKQKQQNKQPSKANYQTQKKTREDDQKKNKETVAAKQQQLNNKKQKIRKQIKMYEDGMIIKLRTPSGDSIKIIVDSQQKVQYLYDYVFSKDDDLGFEDQLDRKFDIIRPYDQLNLSQNMQKTLEVVFESSDMESLIVKQK